MFFAIWGQSPNFFAKVVIIFDKCKYLLKKVATFLQVTTFFYYALASRLILLPVIAVGTAEAIAFAFEGVAIKLAIYPSAIHLYIAASFA